MEETRLQKCMETLDLYVESFNLERRLFSARPSGAEAVNIVMYIYYYMLHDICCAGVKPVDGFAYVAVSLLFDHSIMTVPFFFFVFCFLSFLSLFQQLSYAVQCINSISEFQYSFSNQKKKKINYRAFQLVRFQVYFFNNY